MNKKVFTQFKKIDTNVVLKLICWSAFCLALFAVLTMLMIEKNRVIGEVHDGVTIGSLTGTYTTITQIRTDIGNGTISAPTDLVAAYIQLNAWTPNGTFPIIDFSLMLFFPGTHIPATTPPADAWNMRWNNITLAYSYFFITFLIAIVALALLVFINTRNKILNNVSIKIGMTHVYQNTYTKFSSFYLVIITDFALNLSMVFAFFNFLSTLIVIVYLISISVLKKAIDVISRNKVKFKVDKIKPNKSDFKYLMFVMVFQNFYTVIKAEFTNSFGVNLDLILAIILPIGTVTIIVGLFIKNMMDSKISQVNKSINSAESNIQSLQYYVTANGTRSFDDYNFISILPGAAKQLLNNKNDNQDALNYLNQIFAFYNSAKTSVKNVKDKNYVLYESLIASNVNELNELVANVSKMSKKIK